jgi:hypothetical protein
VLKLALGSTTSRVSISGETTTTASGGVSATTQSGLLVQGTNRGTFEQSDFSAVPEFGLNLRRHLRCGLTASVGYTFLYWADLARAGDQIDLGINPSQIPPGTLVGRARPEFTLQTTDFWVQGLNFGLQYAY